MIRPQIGVTVSRRSGWRIFPLMALNIWLAGGKAIRWTTAADVDIDSVDGVVIGGGDDIGPTLYGGEVALSARLDHARDAMEKWIVEHAIEDGVPLMGICRGAQMLNVALGGTLHQDAYAEYGSRNYQTILPKRQVAVVSNTRLASITQRDALCVNALHRQSVAHLGDELRVAARDENGMVQAIERLRDPFAIGVQWHPEHMFYRSEHRALFKALVVAANAYRDAKDQIPEVDERASKSFGGLGTSSPLPS